MLEGSAEEFPPSLLDFPFRQHSGKTDIAEVWEEASEDLHNFSSILVLNSQRLRNLLKAAEPFQIHLKGGAQDNDEHD